MYDVCDILQFACCWSFCSFETCLQELKEYRDKYHELCTEQRLSSKDELHAAMSGISVTDSDVSSGSSQHTDVVRRLPSHSHSKYLHHDTELD